MLKTVQVPTALADWSPESGILGTKFSRPLIDSDSVEDSFRYGYKTKLQSVNLCMHQILEPHFSKLTEELDEVMEDTLEIVEFNACNVKEWFILQNDKCLSEILGGHAPKST